MERSYLFPWSARNFANDLLRVTGDFVNHLLRLGARFLDSLDIGASCLGRGWSALGGGGLGLSNASSSDLAGAGLASIRLGLRGRGCSLLRCNDVLNLLNDSCLLISL